MALLTLYPEDQPDAEWTTRDAGDIAGWLRRIGVVYEPAEPAARRQTGAAAEAGSLSACPADGAQHVHAHSERHVFEDSIGAVHLLDGGRVYVLVCEPGEAVTVPAGMAHWLDRGQKEAGIPAAAAIVRRFPALEAYRAAF
jgi:hypothetical protein